MSDVLGFQIRRSADGAAHLGADSEDIVVLHENPQARRVRGTSGLYHFAVLVPSRAELAKALKQARAQFAYGSESVTNQGFWYGWSEVFADYHWFETYLDRLATVTIEDVQRAAQKYLRRSNRVIGTYLPK